MTLTEQARGCNAKLCFHVYEADPRSGELRKHGFRVPLESRPFRALLMLLQHANQVVTREELQRELWPADVFIDFDHGLNKAIGKIRRALDDSVDKPRFIETVGRHGYRFIGEVRPGLPEPQPVIPEDVLRSNQKTQSANTRRRGMREEDGAADAASLPDRERRGGFRLGVALACMLVMVAGTAFLVQSRGLRRLKLWDRSAAAPIQSLAVLPLENLSGDPGQEYFSDGMTDELITNLSKIRSLRVASRTSVMHLKGTRRTMAEIAQELQVDAVVEGSVSRVGNQVRIRTQLIRAASDEHIWARSYTTNISDILGVQAGMAQQIANEIRGQLSPDEQRSVAEPSRPANPEAYEAYLKGRYYFNQFSAEGLKKSCTYFDEVVKADPAYAPGYAAIANCYLFSTATGPMLPQEAMPKARAMAIKALELDDSLAEAHEALGMVLLNYEWDWPGAYRELQNAAQLNPNSSIIHLNLASYYRTVARIDDSVREAKLAQRLDPVSPLAHRNLGWLYVFAGRYADAEQELKKCLELDPHFPGTRTYLVRAYDQERMFSPAESEMERDLRDYGENESADQLQQIYRKSGYEKAKRHYFESWIKAAKSPAYDIATWYALLGNKAKALDSLELSYRRRENHMNKLKVNSYFDNLRSEPRFQKLLKDLQLAE